MTKKKISFEVWYNYVRTLKTKRARRLSRFRFLLKTPGYHLEVSLFGYVLEGECVQMTLHVDILIEQQERERERVNEREVVQSESRRCSIADFMDTIFICLGQIMIVFFGLNNRCVE